MLITIPFREYIIQQYEWNLYVPMHIPEKQLIIDHVVHALFFDSRMTEVPFHVDLEHRTWDWCILSYDEMQLFSFSNTNQEYIFEPVVSIW